MNFGNSAEETTPPRTHTPRPEPDAIRAAVESLMSAISNGDLVSFKKIMSDNDRTFSSDILNKHEILHKAVWKLQPEMVGILLDRECKPDIDTLNNSGHTPLLLAIANPEPNPSSGKYQIIDLLMAKGANTKIFATSEISPWSIAASENDFRLAKLLVKHRADPNEVNIAGITPIGRAAININSEMVDLLIKAKAEVNVIPNAIPLHAPLNAILRQIHGSSNTPEKIKILKSIVAAGAKIDSYHIGGCFGDYDLLNILAGGDINTEDYLGTTARKQILNKMKIQTSDPTYKQNKALEIANRKFDAGHLNLVKISLDSIEDSEEKKAFISNRFNNAVEKGKYLEWDLMQELGGVFDVKRHTEKEATAVEIVTDAQKETCKTPSKEEIFKKILEEISHKPASEIHPEEIVLKRFFSEEFTQHELNSEEYFKTIPEKYQGVLKTSADKAFFIALKAAEQSPSHLETVLLAKVHFLYLNPEIDDAPPKTHEPGAIETAEAHADSMEPRATEENVDADLIGNTAEY